MCRAEIEGRQTVEPFDGSELWKAKVGPERSGGGGYPGGYGYSNFWTGGYAAPRPGLTMGYRRSIGQNGDLFLFAPVFLAPVGPLAGAFGY